MSVDKLDNTNCLYSIMTRCMQYELNLFERKTSIEEIKKMSFAELVYWCELADVIRDAIVRANKV